MDYFHHFLRTIPGVLAIIIWPWGPDYPGSWPWTFSTWRRSTSTIMNGRGSWWTTTGSLFYLQIFLSINCSAAISSLTTAWSAQPEKKERWSWTNLFATWSAPLMSLARNGIFLLLYYASNHKTQHNKAWMIFSKEIWNPGTEKGSFVSNHQWRLLLHMADGWYCPSSFWC